MVPVLCDTVVAVAVVVEIDLEVKESVGHYCSAVVIKSFGAIINVLVTFLTNQTECTGFPNGPQRTPNEGYVDDARMVNFVLVTN